MDDISRCSDERLYQGIIVIEQVILKSRDFKISAEQRMQWQSVLAE